MTTAFWQHEEMLKGLWVSTSACARVHSLWDVCVRACVRVRVFTNSRRHHLLGIGKCHHSKAERQENNLEKKSEGTVCFDKQTITNVLLHSVTVCVVTHQKHTKKPSGLCWCSFTGHKKTTGDRWFCAVFSCLFLPSPVTLSKCLHMCERQGEADTVYITVWSRQPAFSSKSLQLSWLESPEQFWVLKSPHSTAFY